MRSCQGHHDFKWSDVTEKTALDGNVYFIMVEQERKRWSSGWHGLRPKLQAENGLILGVGT